ncbi:MAG: ATP phosphoribosyltransferase [Anaerolineaceae bacterium]|nr:ATP phosphoribosyltransferase [Anaerolineaceae bacterium]
MKNSSKQNRLIRLSLPSKGRLCDDSLALLSACGLKVYKPNPRQYEARIPNLPELVILFQRPGDIVSSVRDGSVEFGITGLDILEEKRGDTEDILILHDDLKFGGCALKLAVPEEWQDVQNIEALQSKAKSMPEALRVATKFPNVTARYMDTLDIDYSLIYAEGTLETAPSIGYADIISDLVSSGQTLRDNRLRPLKDGLILKSQAVLIGNKQSLKENSLTLSIARQLLEYIEAYLRATDNLAVFANMRGTSPETIANRIFEKCSIPGLQGPTISRVIVREEDPNWYAVNIIVPRNELVKTVGELRAIGGSGVVVMPVSYIFDEEPPRYAAMLKALGINSVK